jgi:hypothetical protein
MCTHTCTHIKTERQFLRTRFSNAAHLFMRAIAALAKKARGVSRIEVIEIMLHKAVCDIQTAILADRDQRQTFVDSTERDSVPVRLHTDAYKSFKKAIDGHRLFRKDYWRLV